MKIAAFPWVFLCVLHTGLASLAQPPQGETPTDQVSIPWFLKKIEQSKLEELGRGAEYFTKQGCETLLSMDKSKEALELWERCFQMLKKSKGKVESHYLLRLALKMDRIDLAERIVVEAAGQKNSMLDTLAIHRYCKGDKEALKDYPHGKPMMTFYDAMDLGNALIDQNELEKLELFLSDLEITTENEPEDVAGILYKRIASDARVEGDMKTAKTYIDKAFQIAGRQFYTGFTIKVVHRSMHGKLAEEAEQLADLAAAYRGHMARELSQWLINELIYLNEFALAENVASTNLEAPDDRMRVLGSIAKRQAEVGDYRKALGLMRRIKEQDSKDAIRLSVAKALIKAGNREAAIELADLVATNLKPTKEHNTLYSSLAEFEGMCGSKSRIESVLTATDDPYRSALRLLDACDGFLVLNSN